MMCLGHYNEVMRFKHGISCISLKKISMFTHVHWHTVKTEYLDTGENLPKAQKIRYCI